MGYIIMLIVGLIMGAVGGWLGHAKYGAKASAVELAVKS